VSTANTLSVVRTYHAAWTRERFDEAISLLAPELVVEVPINEYPTKEAFAEALTSFGSLVTAVELLSEIADGDQAMHLYDMDVEGLGTMRVVEHYTVADGLITRLRQIHDTAQLRGPRG
jgi:ketosteroid isomerase-like protein